MTEAAAWSYFGDLKPTANFCVDCKCSLIESSNPPSEVTCYTRNGAVYMRSFTSYCKNRHCNKKFNHGFSEIKGLKTYEPFSETTKYLLVSANTAFEMNFLFEVTLHFLHNHASFQGICDVYNTLHGITKERSVIQAKRLTEGWFLYSFLEMSQRNGIQPEFAVGDKWIDESIYESESLLKTAFSEMWMNHTCDRPDCKKVITTDGGMKIHRRLCAAKLSAVKFCVHSDTYQLTGCTKMPSPSSPFCSEHTNSEQPVLLAEKLSTKTRNKLNSYQRKNNKSFLDLPCDSIFVVEKVIDSRKTSSGLEYNVKFSGYPESQACWEPIKNLPKFIQEFYSIRENLSKCLPPPYIIKSKALANGSETIYYLDWHRETNDKFEENLFDMNTDKLDLEELKNECNTRKMKDKRDRRHTIGTLISSFGCGVIPHLDELPLHEGIRCVHASITTFLGSLPEDVREQLEIHFYDDQCHLKAFSEKEQVATKTDITQFFANLHKAVDRFHFKSHKKTDVFCQTKCNPDKVMKEAGISSVNSQSCEQSFVWINQMKQTKTMNEARHKHYLLYLVDLHNLHVVKQVEKANPFKNRQQILRKMPINKKIDIEDVTELLSRATLDPAVPLTEKSASLDEKIEQFEDCFEELIQDSKTILKCKFCDGVYMREGHLRNHLIDKHQLNIKMKCSSCGKTFDTNAKLNRHQKACIKT